MRIVSGKHKGQRLEVPQDIRPTQEKVRKALFDILGDIEGLSFLELFAGSGAVGFEAVSHGIKDLTLVEYNSLCLRAIRKNIDALKLKACSVYPKEVLEAIQALHKDGQRFDLIFIDPPYQGGLVKKTLKMLSTCDILSENGFIIIQHFKKDNLPDSAGDLVLFKQSKYGDTFLSFYKKKSR